LTQTEISNLLEKVKIEEFQSIAGLTAEDCITLYYYMRLTRSFEMRLASLYRQGKVVGGVYLGTGNEATSVGATYALKPEDILAPMHRDTGAHFTKGADLASMALQLLGRANGPTGGKDNGSHHGDKSINTLGMISHLGTMIPVAAGAALASKIKKTKQVAMHFIGDGTSSIGDFHEGINFAAVLNLPVVYVIENNQYAYSTPNSKQFRSSWLAKRAVGYGIPGIVIDGTDVFEVYRVTKWAVDRAREGKGPTLIESQTMRMRGHSEHDAADYVPEEVKQKWEKKDPVDELVERLQSWGVLTDGLKKQIDNQINDEVDAAFDTALEASAPEGSTAAEGVFAG